LSVVTSTGAGPWAKARVKNRRAAAVSSRLLAGERPAKPEEGPLPVEYKHPPSQDAEPKEHDERKAEAEVGSEAEADARGEVRPA
jgi:hypothetical protein